MDELFEHPRFNKVFFRGNACDHAWMDERIEGFARFVREKAPPGSPFLYLFAHNHIKTVIAYFGAIRARMVVVLVEPHIGKLELAEMLEDTPPSVMVRIDPATTEFDRDREFEFHTVDPGRIARNELGDDVCTIVYTNAEDGYAKGAMLTRSSLDADARAFAEMGRYTSESVCVPLLSLAHLYGLQSSVFGPLIAGGQFLIADISSPVRIRSSVHEMVSAGVTHVFAVPLVYYVLTKVPETAALGRTVVCFATGAYPLKQSTVDLFVSKTGRSIHEGYGLTEASPACTWYGLGESPRSGSVGRAMPCCTLAVRDESGEPAATREQGEVFVRGANVMKGYYRREAASRAVMNDGWLRTGDRGYLDEDGYLYLTGRIKKMAKVGGRNVYSAEIERLVQQIPGVSQPSMSWRSSDIEGDVIALRLRLSSGVQPADVHQWMVSNLSAHKVPRDILAE